MAATGRRYRPMRSLRWRLPALLVAAAALASCTSETPVSQSEPVSTRYLAFLLGSGPASEWNEVTTEIQTATERTKSECMRDRGFAYRPRPLSLRVVLGPELRTTDEEYVNRYGFGISTTPQTDGASAEDPNSTTYAGLTDEAQTAWNVAEYDCESTASGSVTENLDLDGANDLLGRIEALVQADSGFVTAQLDGKRCLSDAGYEFDGAGWADLVGSIADQWQLVDGDGSAAFTAKELVLARAAYDCASPMWVAQQSARKAALAQLDDELSLIVFG